MVNFSGMHRVPRRSQYGRAQERQAAIAHYPGGGLDIAVVMALLAAIFAYLSAVVAIIVFFLMSADALLYRPHHGATNPWSEIVAAAKVDPLKMKVPQPARSIAEAIPQRSAAAEYRRRSAASNMRFAEQHKRAFEREARARYGVRRQQRAAPPLALGYAEEPAAEIGYGPWR